MADLSNDELASAVASLGGIDAVKASNTETCRAVAELVRLRAILDNPAVACFRELDELRSARAANAERVRGVVTGLIMDHYPRMTEAIRGFIATRAAEQLATAGPVALPLRKEWDGDAHDRGEESESGDYVDGWNEALDAAQASGAYQYATDLHSAILAILDSDAHAGDVRKALAELVGRQ